ncbi:MAG: flavodoxin [Candidatus Thermoplasmatota archaeon]|nr:flavodoxin [Candidatus Thermoplasmatota archaeon]
MQVIYFSRGGNTRKVAEAIADELNVTAVDVASAGAGSGLVFLGSGNYRGMPGKGLMEFIKKNEFRNRKVALFGTSGGGQGRELLKMEEALVGKGAKVLGKFFCRGQFIFFLNHGKPDEEYLDRARKFAREMVRG